MIQNIVLIGMPGAGKSTVGVVLAKRIGYGFLDTDILLSTREGLPLPRLIDITGYEGFLKRENDAGLSLGCEQTVIATGGSMVLCEGAMTHLKQNGLVVWLRVPLSELEARLPQNLTDRGIAAPSGMGLSALYSMRLPYYQRYADIIVDCGESIETVAFQIDLAVFK